MESEGCLGERDRKVVEETAAAWACAICFKKQGVVQDIASQAEDRSFLPLGAPDLKSIRRGCLVGSVG